MTTYLPKSEGGDLEVTRRCFNGNHGTCAGTWTQYPEADGPCTCDCHSRRRVTVTIQVTVPREISQGQVTDFVDATLTSLPSSCFLLALDVGE
jgi:hypothetical protein